ncbi:MAG: hypothetical protein HY847_04210 [Betaproteobacteria bacterium]|nr:hypothetical protein [Betaproteobacteria bacterium]
MAIRVRSRFHARGKARSPATLASVIAMLAWKIAVESIKRMRTAQFDIDLGLSYFDYVCEQMAFLAHVADRIAYRLVDADQRAAFTRALALRLADVVEDNAEMLLMPTATGACRQHFLEVFNHAGSDYADFSYGSAGPDFGFRRCFADRLRGAVPEKDHLWITDQVMEIEVPEAVALLEKTLPSLFVPADETEGRPRRERLSGD